MDNLTFSFGIPQGKTNKEFIYSENGGILYKSLKTDRPITYVSNIEDKVWTGVTTYGGFSDDPTLRKMLTQALFKTWSDYVKDGTCCSPNNCTLQTIATVMQRQQSFGNKPMLAKFKSAISNVAGPASWEGPQRTWTKIGQVPPYYDGLKYCFDESGLSIDAFTRGKIQQVASFSTLVLDKAPRNSNVDILWPNTNKNIIFDSNFLQMFGFSEGSIIKCQCINISAPSNISNWTFAIKDGKSELIMVDDATFLRRVNYDTKQIIIPDTKDAVLVADCLSFNDKRNIIEVNGKLLEYCRNAKIYPANIFIIGNERKNIIINDGNPSPQDQSWSKVNASIPEKQALLYVKGLGDVLQVIIMMVCVSIEKPFLGGEYAMSTGDSVVYLLCQMFGLNCFYTESKKGGIACVKLSQPEGGNDVPKKNKDFYIAECELITINNQDQLTIIGSLINDQSARGNDIEIKGYGRFSMWTPQEKMKWKTNLGVLKTLLEQINKYHLDLLKQKLSDDKNFNITPDLIKQLVKDQKKFAIIDLFKIKPVKGKRTKEQEFLIFDTSINKLTYYGIPLQISVFKILTSKPKETRDIVQRLSEETRDIVQRLSGGGKLSKKEKQKINLSSKKGGGRYGNTSQRRRELPKWKYQQLPMKSSSNFQKKKKYLNSVKVPGIVRRGTLVGDMVEYKMEKKQRRENTMSSIYNEVLYKDSTNDSVASGSRNLTEELHKNIQTCLCVIYYKQKGTNVSNNFINIHTKEKQKSDYDLYYQLWNHLMREFYIDNEVSWFIPTQVDVNCSKLQKLDCAPIQSWTPEQLRFIADNIHPDDNLRQKIITFLTDLEKIEHYPEFKPIQAGSYGGARIIKKKKKNQRKERQIIKKQKKIIK